MNIIEKIREIRRGNLAETRSAHQWELEKLSAAREAMSTLIDLTNTCGCEDIVVAGMVEGIFESHRYLQQQGIVALFHALAAFGNLPEGQFTDARNEFAHKLCKLLRERFHDELFWRDAR